MKETFLIRTEWYAAIAKLSDFEQAIVFRNLFAYHKGELEAIQTPTERVELIWDILLPQLDRHIKNYDKRCETSASNGKLGGRPKREEPKKPNPEPNNPEGDNGCEGGSDSGKEKVRKIDFRNNVSLTQAEYDRLAKELGIDVLEGLLDFYRDYKIEKRPKTTNDNLTIRRWVIDAYREKMAKQARVVNIQKPQSGYNKLDRKNYWTEEEYQKAVADYNASRTA